jgi:hypothetical protein
MHQPMLDGATEAFDPDSLDTLDVPPETTRSESGPPSDDLVRTYLREIGRIPLLTARQEVDLGRAIEDAQRALRAALAEIPMAVAAIVEIGERLRGGETSVDDVLVSPTGELSEAEGRGALRAFARLARLRGTRNTAAIARTLGALPLRSEVVDDPVACLHEAVKALAAGEGRPADERRRALGAACRSSTGSRTATSASCARWTASSTDAASSSRPTRRGGSARRSRGGSPLAAAPSASPST